MARMKRATADRNGWGAEAHGLTSARSAGRRTWAATVWLVAGTIAVAVTSYSLSLKVAAERREVERLARSNAALETDLKALDAELRVRMRMPQLQRWNDTVLGLVPISATQYLADPLQLAAYGDAIPGLLPPQPRPQLAVRDLAPVAVAAQPRAVLVRADQVPGPAPAVRPAARPEAAPPVLADAGSAPFARPPADAPADLLQQVELSFGTPVAPNPQP